MADMEPEEAEDTLILEMAVMVEMASLLSDGR